MSDSIETTYQIVQERTLPVIVSEIIQIDRTVSAIAMDGAIQIGLKLQEAQKMVPSGEWVKWLDENLNYSKSQAYNFMEIAANYGDRNSAYFAFQTSGNLSISKALELLKVPEEDVETFAENTDIEGSSVRELREKIRQLKEEKEAAEARADALSMEVYSGDEQELSDLQHSVEHLNEQLKDTKEKLKKQKEKLKEVQASKEEEIKKGIEAARPDIEKQAAEKALADVSDTLGQNAEDISRLEAEIEKLEAVNAKLGNTALMEFKVYVDQMQDVYFRINDLITEQNSVDEEVGAKMQAALQKIIEGWKP